MRHLGLVVGMILLVGCLEGKAEKIGATGYLIPSYVGDYIYLNNIDEVKVISCDDDDCVVINPFSGFPSSEITAEFWMRSSDTTRNGSPISYCSAGNNNDFLVYNYNSYSVYVAGDNVNTGISINDGNWHHIAVTWRSSDGQTKLYRDGLPVYTGAMLPSGTTITPGGALVFAQEQDSIGGGYTANQAFEGDIDEIVIYDQVLSDSEILADFNGY